jgi:hypothetical protein
MEWHGKRWNPGFLSISLVGELWHWLDHPPTYSYLEKYEMLQEDQNWTLDDKLFTTKGYGQKDPPCGFVKVCELAMRNPPKYLNASSFPKLLS